jgi:hypothetical protein
LLNPPVQRKSGTLRAGRHAAFAFLFFSARNFAHRAFVAFEIFALAAADITLFLTCVTSRTVVTPCLCCGTDAVQFVLQLTQLFFELSFFTLDCR